MSIHSDRTFGEVLTDMSRTAERLVRAEARLVRAGVEQRATSVMIGAATVVGGLLLAGLSVALLMDAVVLLLAQSAMQPWAASMTVAAGGAVLAAIVAAIGLKILRRSPGESPLAATHGG